MERITINRFLYMTDDVVEYNTEHLSQPTTRVSRIIDITYNVVDLVYIYTMENGHDVKEDDIIGKFIREK